MGNYIEVELFGKCVYSTYKNLESGWIILHSYQHVWTFQLLHIFINIWCCHGALFLTSSDFPQHLSFCSSTLFSLSMCTSSLYLQPWPFFFWTIFFFFFYCSFNFSACDWFLPIFDFFLAQSWKVVLLWELVHLFQVVYFIGM